MQRTRKKSIILRLALLAFCLYMIVSLGQLQFKLIEERRRLSDLNEQFSELTLRNKELANLLENGTEKDFIERAARDRLGYVYSDEEIFTDISGK